MDMNVQSHGKVQRLQQETERSNGICEVNSINRDGLEGLMR